MLKTICLPIPEKTTQMKALGRERQGEGGEDGSQPADLFLLMPNGSTVGLHRPLSFEYIFIHIQEYLLLT